MKRRKARRNFLKATTVAGCGFWLSGGVRPRPTWASALERPQVACLGVGGKGSSDLAIASNYAAVVALCDVDSAALAGAAQAYPNAKCFADFRELFDEMVDRFDACTVSTPDHMHTVMTAMALKNKKHCYTQKPLTRTIGEARYLSRLAAESGLCTQMGNKGSSLDSMRNLTAQIRAGVIGEIREVQIWTNRPVWPQGPNRAETLAGFSAAIRLDDPEIAEEEIAEKKKQLAETLRTLRWDLWLGTAPSREFWPGLYHPFAWRGWWDFGSGALGDMACHTANMPYSACELKNPTLVEATTSGHDFNSFPARSKIKFRFPANDFRPAVDCFWRDGGERPEPSLFERYKIAEPVKSGSLIIGEKGCAYAPNDYAQSFMLLAEGGVPIPELSGVEFRAAPTDERSGNFDARHQFEWWEAIRLGRPEICWSNFERHAGPLTETVLLGNLAVWTAPKEAVAGEKIQWDAERLEVRNLNELKTTGVTELIRPNYADGYQKIEI